MRDVRVVFRVSNVYSTPRVPAAAERHLCSNERSLKQLKHETVTIRDRRFLLSLRGARDSAAQAGFAYMQCSHYANSAGRALVVLRRSHSVYIRIVD